MLKKNETTKLFYNKYLYRLGIYNPIGTIFRNKNFAYASTVLDKLQKDYEEGAPLQVTYVMRVQPIKTTDFTDAQVLFNEFSRYKDDFLIRIENSYLGVYSNDKDWLKRLSYKIKNRKDFTEPRSDLVEFLRNNTNTIIVNNDFGYKYKVTLGGNLCNISFADWLENNLDKVKISDILIEDIRNKKYVAGRYFYITSENVLMLIRLIILDSIQRVDKLVSKLDMDK